MEYCVQIFIFQSIPDFMVSDKNNSCWNGNGHRWIGLQWYVIIIHLCVYFSKSWSVYVNSSDFTLIFEYFRQMYVVATGYLKTYLFLLAFRIVSFCLPLIISIFFFHVFHSFCSCILNITQISQWTTQWNPPNHLQILVIA